MKRILALVLFTVGVATTAHADFIPASWTDSVNFGSGAYIGWGDSRTYTHNLNDNGFRPGTDFINRFDLGVRLVDDSSRDSGEWASVSIDLPWLEGGLQAGATSVSTTVSSFGLSSGRNLWSLVGLIELNTLGALTVTITSMYGDFRLVGSDLTAHGFAYTTTNVPEPGALGLLGIGLLGMAMSMRRRVLSVRS